MALPRNHGRERRWAEAVTKCACASKGKGKSGGARVITCVRVVGNVVWLLTIYDKSQQATITDKELMQLVAQVP